METLQLAADWWHEFHGNVIGKYREFVDPSSSTADEELRNAGLRAAKQQLTADIAALQANRAAASTAAAEALAEAERAFNRAAEPKLDALDVLDTAVMVYGQIESHVAESADKIRGVAQSELEGYGYQSKMVASLTLTLDALRRKMVSGAPFGRELAAVAVEVSDAKEVNYVTTTLREFENDGIDGVPSLVDQARGLVREVDEARLHWLSAKRAPAVEAQPTQFVSWLSQLKVDVPRAAAPPAESSPNGVERFDSLRNALDSVVSDLSANKIEAALHTLASREDYGGIADRAAALQRRIEGRVIADTALRFSDSLVTVMRFRFVEPILTAGDARSA